MALRAVVEAMPHPVPGVVATRDIVESYSSISRILIPRIAGPSGMLESDVGLTPDTVDVLIEIVRCFGPMLQPFEIENLQTALVALLERDKGNSVIKKRAVVAMSMLAHYFSEDLLRHFISRVTSLLGQPHLPPVTRRLYITIIGSIARSIPYRFGAYLPELVPFILHCLGEEELQSQLEEISENTEASLVFNEVREAALVALEAFLASCPTQMRPFTADAIDASLRYLKFDPNYAMDDDDEMDEDEDDEDPDEDDEYEADGGFDDDDDASWKVRRCAAKTLYTIVSTRSSGDLLESGVLYGKVAPALAKRFDEREENVRLEVISTMALLVRKTGEGVIPEFSIDDSQSELPNQPPHSRKRRRQSSGGGASAFALTLGLSSLSGTGLTSPTTEKIPASGPQADLAGLTPTIIKSSVKLLKGKLIPTKQATINLLDDLVTVQRGGLGPYFDQIIAPIIDAIKSSATTSASTSLSVAGGSASATAATLKISALRLTSDIVKNHSSAMLQPHLPSIVAGVVSVTHDRFYKISGGGIQTAEEVVKAITPPRSRLTAQKFKGELQKLYDVIIDRTVANDADVEVRQKAIHALGTLLARTSGPEGSGLLPEDKQKAALGHLLERLKNETTRLAAVRAVDNIAALSSSSGVQFNAAWIREVAVELSAQLRKANRALRGSSIMALKHLILSPATKGTLDDATIKSIVSDLILVIPNNDAQLLGPGLLVLAHLAQEKPKIVITSSLIQALCTLLQSTVPGSVLDSLVVLVTDIGQVGCGKELMKGLLMDVGVGGEPSVVGKVIGTLLVASGDSAGVSINSFVEEVKTNSDDQARASLGLAVLGEAGLRLGPKSSLTPNLFLQQLSHRSDKVALSAAVALGRAGAGHVAEYVPTILSAMNTGASQYLLLQSIKEVLQQAALALTDLKEFSTPIWDRVLAASAVEDNKAVCAECIGRMVLIDPRTNMPKLEVCGTH
jgi:cullin-associated NEDD8-dissociated protein 1